MINRKIVLFVAYISVFLSIRPQTTYLFSHGLGGTFEHAFAYAKSYKINGKTYHNKSYFFYQPFFSFNYPNVANTVDTSSSFPGVNRNKTSLAQDNEIACLKTDYEKAIEENMRDRSVTHHNMVLFGISCGASAIINFVGLHNPQHVKALVLESPFDSVATIIDYKLNWLPHFCGEYIIGSIFKKYNQNGVHPINLVDKIDKDMKILIICSKQDKLIPWYSSASLYQKLRISGYKHVYIYIADHGEHANIINNKDGQTYRDVVHAFYRTYNLPYDPQFAENGQKQLDLCQPTL